MTQRDNNLRIGDLAIYEDKLSGLYFRGTVVAVFEGMKPGYTKAAIENDAGHTEVFSISSLSKLLDKGYV